jgi:hypothetical protein
MRTRMWSKRPLALFLSGLLGAGAALLVSCGGGGKLIPVANSEPLQRDFEEVARAAEAGHGSCASTEAALRTAEHDFAALPASVDPGLKRRLREGLTKLHADALELCTQPAPQSTVATTVPRTTATTPTTTAPTTTQTTTTQTTPSTSTTNTGPGGGTPAPKEEGEEEPSKHKGDGKGAEPGAPGGALSPGEGK